MSRWFRVYDELVDDPKVQCLAPELFRVLVNVWCIASKHKGRLPPMAQMAFALRMTLEQATAAIAALRAAGLIEGDAEGSRPHNWDGRQFKSDGSNERVGRFRQRQRNGECNAGEPATVTPPESETETESESESEPESEPEKENARAARALSWQEFEQKVWEPYPRTPVMSKDQAWRAWGKARDEDRAAIAAAIPRYAAWLKQKKPDHSVLNVATFIGERRFDGFAERVAAPPAGFYARLDSPQLAAWDAHSRVTRGRGLPRDRNGGWWVATEWPPGHPAHDKPGEQADPKAQAEQREQAELATRPRDGSGE
jgi:hypothetical protein